MAAEMTRKKLEDITRAEWIAWYWEEDPVIGEEGRCFVALFRRSPDEAAQAMEDWDATAEERSMDL